MKSVLPTADVNFRSYSPKDKEACLAIFDANCPEFFAPNERSDYTEFLGSIPADYEVCLSGDSIVGALGLTGEDPKYKSINWILISPDSQGLGIGSIFMNRAINLSRVAKLEHIKIAASHLSAPFFAKYGAAGDIEIKDGWGPDMHRIDMELHLYSKKP